jgi:hypothetical protein
MIYEFHQFFYSEPLELCETLLHNLSAYDSKGNVPIGHLFPVWRLKWPPIGLEIHLILCTCALQNFLPVCIQTTTSKERKKVIFELNLSICNLTCPFLQFDGEVGKAMKFTNFVMITRMISP